MADTPASGAPSERKSVTGGLGSIFNAAKQLALLKLEEKLAEERAKMSEREPSETVPINDEPLTELGASIDTPDEVNDESMEEKDDMEKKDDAEEKDDVEEKGGVEDTKSDLDTESEKLTQSTLEDEKQPSFGYLLNAAKTLASRLDSRARSFGGSMDEDDSDTDDEEEHEEQGDDPQKPKRAQSVNLSNAKAQAEANNSTKSLFEGLAGNFMKVVAGSDKTQDDKERTITAIVSSVCEQTESGQSVEASSIREIIDMMGKYKGKLGEVAQKFMGDIDFRKMSPTAVAYYLEKQDEDKNPSWKRRRHRFCPYVNTDTIHELNDALYLALLSYADTAEEIREGLEDFKTPYELAACTVVSNPGQPAHFVAVKRDQASNSKYKRVSSSLKVVIGVRGTKSAADAITDLLCDTADYRGGKAHAMILEAGKYVAGKHIELLQRLRETAGKKSIKITLIGHSLGAGAASIAGMELKALEDPTIQVKQVVGFGCPALVSRDLAEEASFITTVVNDSDVVPRMSGVSAANLLLDIMAFDWFAYAETDLHNALTELQKRHSFLIRESTANRIEQAVLPLLKSHLEATKIPDRTERLTPEVYPPGNCIHFYRDGRGVSACFVPNTFFAEVDVTRRMIDDHVFHSGYQQTLLEIARQRAMDHHFRFE